MVGETWRIERTGTAEALMLPGRAKHALQLRTAEVAGFGNSALQVAFGIGRCIFRLGWSRRAAGNDGMPLLPTPTAGRYGRKAVRNRVSEFVQHVFVLMTLLPFDDLEVR